MAGKFLSRTVRRRSWALTMWAMMPLAMLNGRSVSGCMSPTGHFELGCNCQAMQDLGFGTPKNASMACGCHCACCQGKTCCRQGKSICCSQMAGKDYSSPENGVGGGHCRPVSMYVTTPVVSAAAQTTEVRHLAGLSLVSLDVPLSAASQSMAEFAELNTGPLDNLVVALHRFLI